MTHIYRVVRVVEKIDELEKEVNRLLDEGWKLVGGITTATAVGDEGYGPIPTLVYLQAMTREE
jgi:hypothetical protein